MQYDIKRRKYDDGASLFYLKTPSDDITVIANINAGSLYETDTNNGISHFIEHNIFKGTDKRLSRDHIYNEIGLLGNQSYCYTTNGNIPLGIRVIPEDFDNALELISDLLYNSKMDHNEIEKEKDIVLSEIRDRIDDHYAYLWDKFTEEIFSGCELSRPIIGYKEIIENLKTEDVQHFYRKMFTPANTTIFVAGSKEFSEIEGKIYDYFGNYKNIGEFHNLPKINVPKNKLRNIVLQRELDNIRLMIGKIVPSSTHEDHYALDILSTVLSRSISDRILNQEPISYERWAYYNCNRVTGRIMIYATSEMEDYNRVIELINEELFKYYQGNIPESYILDAKKEEKKKFILENSTTMAKAKKALDFWLLGDIEDINHYIERVDALTVEQVKEAGKKYINLEDMLYMSLGNFNQMV